MQHAAAPPDVGAELEQRRVLEELTRFDRLGDAHDVLRHDAAGAEVEVTDLGVPHLSLGEADVGARRLEEGPGKPRPELVPHRRGGQLDGVPGAAGAEAPAVEHHEDHRSTTSERCV